MRSSDKLSPTIVQGQTALSAPSLQRRRKPTAIHWWHGTAPIAINPSFYRKIPYDPVKDFAPATNIAYSTSVLVVHTSTGVNSLAESKQPTFVLI